jgi:hypothetical protein
MRAPALRQHLLLCSTVSERRTVPRKCLKVIPAKREKHDQEIGVVRRGKGMWRNDNTTVSRSGLEIAEITRNLKGRILAAQRPLKSLPTLGIRDYIESTRVLSPDSIKYLWIFRK